MGYRSCDDRYQVTMFPEIIDDYVSDENPVRVMDAYVNSLNMGELGFKAEPAETGRPPYNPKDILKLYIYGHSNKIRSSRRLETESKRNVELMWLINNQTPDHKTIAEFRRKHPEALKKVFRNFVVVCRKFGLYGCEDVVVDGSKFRAVNSADNNFDVEKLEDRLKRIDEKLERYMSELDENDKKDETEAAKPKHSKEEIAAAIAELTERKGNYEGMKTKLETTGETQISTVDPDSRRMKQANGGSDICYNVQTAVDSKHKLIAAYDVTNSCNDKNQLAPMGKAAKKALNVEHLTMTGDTGYFVASDLAECICNGITPQVSSKYDSVTFCIPVSAEEAAAEANKAAAGAADETTDEAVNETTAETIAETASESTTKATTKATTEATTEAAAETTTEKSSKAADKPRQFNNPGKNVLIRDRNIGLCPMGNVLYPRSYRKSINSAVYSNAEACRNCPRRKDCKGYDRELKVKMPQSKFTKQYNDADLHVKQITYSADKAFLRKRKEIVEHPFGTIKRSMDSSYCLLKGIAKVSGEFALTFLAYNLKRAINILGVAKMLQEIRG